MSSIRLPRSASAAARLMAVVVLPTPPFWFAIATIIKDPKGGNDGDCNRIWSRGRQPPCSERSGQLNNTARSRPLHLVAQVVGIQALQPLVEPIGVVLFG